MNTPIQWAIDVQPILDVRDGLHSVLDSGKGMRVNRGSIMRLRDELDKFISYMTEQVVYADWEEEYVCCLDALAYINESLYCALDGFDLLHKAADCLDLFLEYRDHG